MKQCANLFPELFLITEDGWNLVLEEIIYKCKHIFDAEVDIAIERLLYSNKGQKKADLRSIFDEPEEVARGFA